MIYTFRLNSGYLNKQNILNTQLRIIAFYLAMGKSNRVTIILSAHRTSLIKGLKGTYLWPLV